METVETVETSEAQQIIKLLTEMRDERREEFAYNRNKNEEFSARQQAAITTQAEAVALQKKSAGIQRGTVRFLGIFSLLGAFVIAWFLWWVTKSGGR